jgi:phage FluMu gp28-like protein
VSGPILLPYQREWVLDRAQVKVCVKSRRIGITWATAYEAVEVAMTAESDGGSDFWYMSYSEASAKEFIPDVVKWSRALGVVASRRDEVLSDSQAAELYLLAPGQRSIQVTSLTYASGHRVHILPALPRALRGKDGMFCVDEAAYSPDLKAVLVAANAFKMWGGRVAVISTQGDVDGAFNQLVENIRGGRGAAARYSLHVVTLLDAVAQGLYKRICESNGWKWSEKAERQWVDDCLAEDGADCEYLCIPRRSGGTYLPRDLVEACMHADYRVVHFRAKDEFLKLPEVARDRQVDTWLRLEVDPWLAKLPRDKPHYLGEDFGRARDGTVLAIGYLARDLTLEVPLLLELWNVPFESQKRVLEHVGSRLPRLSGMVLDATGNGSYLAEQAVLRWGEEIAEPAKMNDPWYAEQLPKARARFQDLGIRIPKDLDVLQDLGAFQVIDGVPKLPKLRTLASGKDLQGIKRHGDAGIAIACLVAAASKPAFSYGYQAVPKRGGHFNYEGTL